MSETYNHGLKFKQQLETYDKRLLNEVAGTYQDRFTKRRISKLADFSSDSSKINNTTTILIANVIKEVRRLNFSISQKLIAEQTKIIQKVEIEVMQLIKNELGKSIKADLSEVKNKIGKINFNGDSFNDYLNSKSFVATARITEIIKKGKSETYIIKEIEELLQKQKRFALKVARTEMMNFVREIYLAISKANGVKFVKWVCSTSSSNPPCKICKSRDKQLFPIDNVPSDHPNGRCIFVPTSKDIKIDLSTSSGGVGDDIDEQFRNYFDTLSPEYKELFKPYLLKGNVDPLFDDSSLSKEEKNNPLYISKLELAVKMQDFLYKNNTEFIGNKHKEVKTVLTEKEFKEIKSVPSRAGYIIAHLLGDSNVKYYDFIKQDDIFYKYSINIDDIYKKQTNGSYTIQPIYSVISKAYNKKTFQITDTDRKQFVIDQQHEYHKTPKIQTTLSGTKGLQTILMANWTGDHNGGFAGSFSNACSFLYGGDAGFDNGKVDMQLYLIPCIEEMRRTKYKEYLDKGYKPGDTVCRLWRGENSSNLLNKSVASWSDKITVSQGFVDMYGGKLYGPNKIPIERVLTMYLDETWYWQEYPEEFEFLILSGEKI